MQSASTARVYTSGMAARGRAAPGKLDWRQARQGTQAWANRMNLLP